MDMLYQAFIIKRIVSWPSKLMPFLLLWFSFMATSCSVNEPESASEDFEENVEELTSRGCPVDEKMAVNVCGNMEDGWIFCDDFESDDPLRDRYFDYGDSDEGFTVEEVGRGGGKGMRAIFEEGEVSAGNIKLAFGRHEIESIADQSVMNDRNFNEIYWQIDLCHEADWSGGGGHKFVRTTTLLEGWAQGHIAHIWSMGGDEHHYLGQDPASGIDEEGKLVTTRYNDFENLRWLGSNRGSTPLFNSDSVGKWYRIEGHVKLNTPGKSDGVFEFWIDGELQGRRDNFNWHSTWNEDPENYGINAIFVENYWNNPGSVQRQERYFDNLVVSTKRIGDFSSDK